MEPRHVSLGCSEFVIHNDPERAQGCFRPREAFCSDVASRHMTYDPAVESCARPALVQSPRQGSTYAQLTCNDRISQQLPKVLTCCLMFMPVRIVTVENLCHTASTVKHQAPEQCDVQCSPTWRSRLQFGWSFRREWCYSYPLFNNTRRTKQA